MGFPVRKVLLVSAAVTAAALFSTGAQAVTCNSGDAVDYSGALTSNSGCEIGSTNNDKASKKGVQVNDDNLFGGGWTFAAKDDDVNGSLNGTTLNGGYGFTVNGKKSGSWSFAKSLFDDYAEALIVQKGGKGSDQSTYVGFLITGADGNSGSYSTVFSKLGKKGKVALQNISHISLYVRGTPTNPGPGPAPVPVPAAGLLLIGGLGAIGGLRARRKS